MSPMTQEELNKIKEETLRNSAKRALYNYLKKKHRGCLVSVNYDGKPGADLKLQDENDDTQYFYVILRKKWKYGDFPWPEIHIEADYEKIIDKEKHKWIVVIRTDRGAFVSANQSQLKEKTQRLDDKGKVREFYNIPIGGCHQRTM